ncbi:MAG: hypothetical protein N2C14_18000, partial [Planctomycetales bacterium]
ARSRNASDPVPSNSSSIPIIDVASLLTSDQRARRSAADEINRACRNQGFFYIVGHGVSETLIQELERLSREFFAVDQETKMVVEMKRGGRAWRGYFPVGAELTLGQPDQKEGIYFGAELSDDHPQVKSGTPLHGRNLFPEIPGYRETVLDYLDAMTRLGHALMEGVALSLGLPASYFADRYTGDPLILFRVFHYPPLPDEERNALWSVGEHTDYGVLTILKQDGSGGLQVKSRSEWIDAPPIAGSFVCNIGDMLDRMTGGLYRSTPHRVRNESSGGRLSFPFFFDPNWDAEVRPIDPGFKPTDDSADRWDAANIHELTGTYGEYLMKKVAKVFPALGRREL